MAEIEIPPLDLVALVEAGRLPELGLHRGGKARLGSLERHTGLRTLRAGDRGRDLAKVERERVAEDRIGCRFRAEHPLRACIGLDELDARVLASRCFDIV